MRSIIGLHLRFWVRGTIAPERMEAIIAQVEASIMGSREELGVGDISTRFDYDRADVYINMRTASCC